MNKILAPISIFLIVASVKFMNIAYDTEEICLFVFALILLFISTTLFIIVMSDIGQEITK